MAEDYIPKNDMALDAWLTNFITVANANMTALGLVAADITPVTTSRATFDFSINAAETAKMAALAATQDKATRRKAVVTLTRALARRIQAAPGATNALKQQLGLTVRAADTSTPPTTPESLVVTGNTLGVNTITWDKNGNKPNTQYVVQSKVGVATEWNYVGVTTKLKYDDVGQTPGVKVSYKVCASRAGFTSQCSQTVTIYG